MFNPHNVYITVPEAAKLVGLSPKSMHALIDHGVIAAIRPNKQRRVCKADVLRFRDGVAEPSRPSPVLAIENSLED